MMVRNRQDIPTSWSLTARSSRTRWKSMLPVVRPSPSARKTPARKPRTKIRPRSFPMARCGRAGRSRRRRRVAGGQACVADRGDDPGAALQTAMDKTMLLRTRYSTASKRPTRPCWRSPTVRNDDDGDHDRRPDRAFLPDRRFRSAGCRAAGPDQVADDRAFADRIRCRGRIS